MKMLRGAGYLFFISLLFFIAPVVAQAAYDSNFQKGFNFPSWWFDSYSQSWSDESFQNLLQEKPTWIAVGPFWYQKDQYATSIYAHRTRTANDAGVEHVIQMAHEQGVKVMLKPSVDAENGKWRGRFQPKDANAWFASYTAMAVHYAKMAERLKVESYLIGAEYELLSVPVYADKWREVARAVRREYSGEIGYGANWGKKGKAEFEKINWWDALDFIGIHAYFPISTTNAATLDDMVASWSGIRFEGSDQHWIEQIEAVQSRYGKPVVFSEAGYKSCDGGTRIPWWCNPNAPVDLQEQSDGNESLLKVFQDKPWLKGIFWWMWNIKPWHGGATDKDHNLNQKPVRDVIRRYWWQVESPSLPAPVDSLPESVPENAPPDPEPVLKEPVTLPPAPSSASDARDRIPPHAPEHIFITQENGKSVLTWKDPSDEDFFRILILRNHGGTTPVSGTPYAGVQKGAERFVDEHVEPGETYRYSVRAEDIHGNHEQNTVTVDTTIPGAKRPFLVYAPPIPSGFGFVPPIRETRASAAPVPSYPGSSVFSAPAVSVPPPVQSLQRKQTLVYGIPRSLSKEQKGEQTLWKEIKKAFRYQKKPRIHRQAWRTYVRAYTYGGYPIDVIVEDIRGKGPRVHPSIPWAVWKKKKQSGMIFP